MIKELVVISGKGGTGKTSITACLAQLAGQPVLVDADVDASNLHLLLTPSIEQTTEFRSGHTAVIRPADCIGCGVCLAHCRFGAVTHRTMDDPWRESHGAQILCQDCDFCKRSCSVQVNRAIQAMQEAHGNTAEVSFQIDPLACEGCGVCVRFCPVKAIDFPPRLCGEWYVSDTRCGPMVHARLGTGAENSGKLVSLIRQQGRQLAQDAGAALVMIDGPPGIGCPVMASLTGADLILAITEPTLSGIHDLERVAELARRFDIPMMVGINKWDINPDQTASIEDYLQESQLIWAGRIRCDRAFVASQIKRQTVLEYASGGVVHEIHALWRHVQETLDTL